MAWQRLRTTIKKVPAYIIVNDITDEIWGPDGWVDAKKKEADDERIYVYRDCMEACEEYQSGPKKRLGAIIVELIGNKEYREVPVSVSR